MSAMKVGDKVTGPGVAPGTKIVAVSETKYKNRASATYKWGVVILSGDGFLSVIGFWFKSRQEAATWARSSPYQHYAIARRWQ